MRGMACSTYASPPRCGLLAMVVLAGAPRLLAQANTHDNDIVSHPDKLPCTLQSAECSVQSTSVLARSSSAHTMPARIIAALRSFAHRCHECGRLQTGAGVAVLD